MSTLKISLAEVSECASRIRSLNQQMYDQLTEMKREMNSTNAAWISDAGDVAIKILILMYLVHCHKKACI